MANPGGESKNGPQGGPDPSASLSALTGYRAAPVVADRSWLSKANWGEAWHKPVERDRLARQLGRATSTWEEKKRNERKRSKLRSASASRAELNFVMHEVNSMNCVIKFAIGMKNEKFNVKFAPAWTPMQPAQFFVQVSDNTSESMKEWADALNKWNATEEGGSFSYPHEAMLAFLREAERSYINRFDSAEDSENTGKDPSAELSDARHGPESAFGSVRTPHAIRQNSADQLRTAWDTYDADTSQASFAKKRILIDYAKLQQEDIEKDGIQVELVDGNPFLWKITMTDFQGRLGSDLMNHAFAQSMDTGGGTPVVMEARFPSEFPLSPPFLRIVRPIFQEFTGRVAGGALCIPRLMSKGWDPRADMHRILSHVKHHLEKYGARVHPASGMKDEYPMDTTKECWSYINDREPIPGTQSAEDAMWSMDLIILSASFARRNILDGAGGTPLHGALLGDGGKQFDGGNKVIMPESLYSTIDTIEQQRRQNVLFRERSQGENIYGKGALTFQITTPMGIRGFCGLLQCLSPEPNQIIVPDWMMRSMFLDECTTVNVRTAELDKIAGLTLQPCNSDFQEDDVIAATGKGTKMFLTDALTSFTSITRGQTITLGSRHIYDITKPYTTYNFIVKEVIPNVPAVALWSGFESDLPCKFDKPLIQTAGLPPRSGSKTMTNEGKTPSTSGEIDNHNGESKESSAVPLGEQVRKRFEQQHRKQEDDRLAAKEKLSNLCQIKNYRRDGEEGTVKVRVHLGERGGAEEERVLKIKAHPSSLACDLYDTVQSICEHLGLCPLQDQTSRVEGKRTYRYYLEDRSGRRIPRYGDESSGETTISLLGGKKGKVFRVFQRVSQETECYVVRKLAEKIAAKYSHELTAIDAGNADEVRNFIRNTKIVRGVLATSVTGNTARDSNPGEGKTSAGDRSSEQHAYAADDKSSAVAELIEYLVPYIQGAANAEVAWAPPGGWICASCDNVNLKLSGPEAKTFGDVICQHCGTKREYTLEEISDIETWELEHFLHVRGVRASSSFPTQEELVRTVVAVDPSLVSEASSDVEELFNNVGLREGVKNGSETTSTVHTIVLPNGDTVGLSRPAIVLSKWFFTLRDIASNDELKLITPSFLVENIGADIL